ncbi:SAF domain-containing protein [Saccharothrix mutabilis subsp. mutabilis]|uniref:SAF domain-containing protein n=1 Tax=Saccharothrix mutabilis subsp. mutabilis TaxID=66855 RepID=A0ABN0T9Y2_9PSEU
MNLMRKILAVLFLLVATGVAVWPAPAGVEVAVAAHDLAAGVPLTPGDVVVHRIPPELSPGGAVPVERAVGRALVSPARAGEPLTDLRLSAANPDTASVAVRLGDPAVAGLLTTGARVDVVAQDRVLAEAASVVAVRDGEVAVLNLDRAAATRVASESLAQPVALTLR